MKKISIAVVLISSLFSCKKETTISNNSSNNTTNSSTCVDNPNINFKSIGTAIGKSADCIKDIEGNTYKVVTIGSQTWMAENLKTTKYNDGSVIQNLKDDKEWSNASSSLTAAWCYYKNDSTNNVKFGKLYNWYVANSKTNGGKNVCPTGWHIPNDNEWNTLNTFLGGSQVSGSKLKETGTSSWSTPNTDATNTSLFTALPGGYRFQWGDFVFKNKMGYWWSSDEMNSLLINAYSLDFSSVSFKITSGWSKGYASSIRCLKD